MLDRLLCFFRRHQWCEWVPVAKSFWACGDETRWCQRCGRFDYRWNFNKHFAVGSIVRIRVPERYTVTYPPPADSPEPAAPSSPDVLPES